MLFSLVLAVCCGLFLPERLAKIRKSEAFCVRTHAKADTIAKMRDAEDWRFPCLFVVIQVFCSLSGYISGNVAIRRAFDAVFCGKAGYFCT